MKTDIKKGGSYNKMNIFSLFRTPKKHGSSSIKRSWIISYVVILLLPLIINSFIYLHSYRTIAEQTRESQISALEHLRSNMDNVFERIDEAVSVISYDINLNYLLNSSGLSSFQQNYATASRLYDLCESLRLAIPSDSIITDYYIFSPKNSLVFHNSGVNDIESYGQHPDNYTNPLFEICKELNPQTINLFVFEPTPDHSYLAFMYPLPYAYLPKGYIVFLVEQVNLSEVMKGFYPQQNSQIYLVDEDYQSLNTSLALAQPNYFSTCDFSDGPILDRLPGTNEKYFMYSSASQVLPLHYVYTVPESIAMAELIYMRRFLNISLLFCLIGGVFLILLLTKYNYTPWQKLVNTIEELSNSSIQKGTNEYQLVLNALIDSYREKATVEEVLQRKNQTLYSFYLTQMLTGYTNIENIEEEILEDMENNLSLSSFAVLISLMDVKENWSSNHTELAGDVYLSLFDTHIVQRLRELLGSSFSITFTEVHDYTVCIIGMGNQKTDTWQVKLSSAIEKISEELSGSLDLQFCFSSSNLHHGILELPVAWNEAFSTIFQSIMGHEKALTYYEDMEFSHTGSYTYSSQTEQALVNLIQLGQTEEATTQIRSLMDETARYFHKFEVAKCMTSDIFCSITKAFIRLPDSSRENLQNEYYSIVESFMQSNSYGSLQNRILEAAALVSDAFRQTTDTVTARSAWIDKIEEQLALHLYDENLNVMFLSHKLGVSSKYLSAIYFEANGVSIMDTIHKRRIEKFKELICKENMNIQDAAAFVGYHSNATLNRWVKKYEGVTPGQLKAITSNLS